MALQRPEGTSYIEAGLSRKGASLSGIINIARGLNAVPPSTVEAVVATILLPTKLLNNEGKGLAFSILGSTAANGNNKQARLRLSSLTGTLLADTGAVAANAQAWSLSVTLIRTGLLTQDVFSINEIGSTQATTFVQLTQNSNTGLTTFVVTLTNASANTDSALRYWSVSLLTEGGVQTAGGVLQ